jgi:hypothetical protein
VCVPLPVNELQQSSLFPKPLRFCAPFSNEFLSQVSAQHSVSGDRVLKFITPP